MFEVVMPADFPKLMFNAKPDQESQKISSRMCALKTAAEVYHSTSLKSKIKKTILKKPEENTYIRFLFRNHASKKRME